MQKPLGSNVKHVKYALKNILFLHTDRVINLNEGEAAIQAKFGQVTVVNRSMELCSIDEELFNCPIQKGITHYDHHF